MNTMNEKLPQQLIERLLEFVKQDMKELNLDVIFVKCRLSAAKTDGTGQCIELLEKKHYVDDCLPIESSFLVLASSEYFRLITT